MKTPRLWRTDTHARAVADFADPVEGIDHVETRRQLLRASEFEDVCQARVQLHVVRQMRPVRDARAIGQRECCAQA